MARHQYQKGESGSPKDKFTPGKSGNPAGRPAGRISDSRALQLVLEADPGQAVRIMRAMCAIAENKTKRGAKRPPHRVSDQIRAAEFCFDRWFGKPTQAIDLSTPNRLIVLPPDETDPATLPERDPELLAQLAGDGNGNGNGAGEHE